MCSHPTGDRCSIHASGSNAGPAVARRSSANPRAAYARLLHSICERERDRHQSERCGYPFGPGDPASLPSPPPPREIKEESARMSENSRKLRLSVFPGTPKCSSREVFYVALLAAIVVSSSARTASRSRAMSSSLNKSRAAASFSRSVL